MITGCSVPVELFYIERGCNSRTEIWERETKCKNTCIQLHLVQGQSCSLPSLPSPSPLSHPSCKCDKGSQLAPISAPPLPHPRTPHRWIWTVFSDLGQKRGRPPFRSLKMLQLNLDSFCDHVPIFGAVMGHLEAEIDFWIFLRKWWKSRRTQRIWQSAEILTSRAGTTAGTVRERRRPYKLGGLCLQITWCLHAREATSPERELFSQTWRKSAVGDSAEPK